MSTERCSDLEPAGSSPELVWPPPDADIDDIQVIDLGPPQPMAIAQASAQPADGQSLTSPLSIVEALAPLSPPAAVSAGPVWPPPDADIDDIQVIDLGPLEPTAVAQSSAQPVDGQSLTRPLSIVEALTPLSRRAAVSAGPIFRRLSLAPCIAWAVAVTQWRAQDTFRFGKGLCLLGLGFFLLELPASYPKGRNTSPDVVGMTVQPATPPAVVRVSPPVQPDFVTETVAVRAATPRRMQAGGTRRGTRREAVGSPAQQRRPRFTSVAHNTEPAVEEPALAAYARGRGARSAAGHRRRTPATGPGALSVAKRNPDQPGARNRRGRPSGLGAYRQVRCALLRRAAAGCGADVAVRASARGRPADSSDIQNGRPRLTLTRAAWPSRPHTGAFVASGYSSVCSARLQPGHRHAGGVRAECPVLPATSIHIPTVRRAEVTRRDAGSG